MLRESGRVINVEDDAVWVEVVKHSTCGGCVVGTSCSHNVLARTGNNHVLIRAIKTPAVIAVEYSINDEVDIEFPESTLLTGAFLAYFLPLALAMAGAVIGEFLASAKVEVVSVIGSLLGLMLGFLLVRTLSHWIGLQKSLEPWLVARNTSRDTADSSLIARSFD